MPNPTLITLCSCPDQTNAEKLARLLVDHRLAACINIVQNVTSVYRWEGEVEQQGECLLIIKTDQQHYPALERLIKEKHPYQVPEIIAFPVLLGSSEYLQWLSKNLS